MIGCVLKNMTDESLRDHLVLQSKRLTTYAMVRDEVMDAVQARAAIGSSPMLVDALMDGKGKGKGKKAKGESKDTKRKNDKDKRKGWKNSAEDSGDKSEDSKDSAQKTCFCCDRTGHVKSDCQQRAEDMRKATAAGRPFVDTCKNVSALQNHR